MFVAVDGRLAGLVGVADPIKATTPEAHRGAARGGLRIVMLTGDSHDRRGGRAQARHRRGPSPRCCPSRRPSVIRGCRREGASWRWRATASTTPRRSPRPTSASRWAPAPTSRWRAPDHAGEGRPARHRARAPACRATMRNIRQNLFFAFVYNALGVPIAAGVLGLPSCPGWRSCGGPGGVPADDAGDDLDGSPYIPAVLTSWRNPGLSDRSCHRGTRLTYIVAPYAPTRNPSTCRYPRSAFARRRGAGSRRRSDTPGGEAQLPNRPFQGAFLLASPPWLCRPRPLGRHFAEQAFRAPSRRRLS